MIDSTDRDSLLTADRDNLVLALRFIQFYLGGRDGTELAQNEAALRFNTEHALRVAKAALAGQKIEPTLNVNARKR